MIDLVFPSAKLIRPPGISDSRWIAGQCWLAEYGGRMSRKSQDRMTPGSHKEFLKKWAVDPTIPHGSILRHGTLSFHLVGSRLFSHQIVRHGLSHFTQESTRYCDYRKKDCLSVVAYPWEMKDKESLKDLKEHAEYCYKYYKKYKDRRSPPEAYRRYLPHSTKTEVFMTANIQEWRHVIFARVSDPGAEKEIKYIINLCRKKLTKHEPELFCDLEYHE